MNIKEAMDGPLKIYFTFYALEKYVAIVPCFTAIFTK